MLLFRLVYFIFLYFVGASLNVMVEDESSPLHWAAGYNNLEVTQLLLQKGEFRFLIEYMTVAYIKM